MNNIIMNNLNTLYSLTVESYGVSVTTVYPVGNAVVDMASTTVAATMGLSAG